MAESQTNFQQVNTHQPKISVLIPIYNVEKYLRECLSSLAAQTFTDFEALCINDGSTDNSQAIIEEFCQDPRFRLINKENSGYGASMNRGLKEATGEYIAILESDDFLDAEALETELQVAEAFSAEVVKAGFYFYWSEPTPHDEFCELMPKQDCGRLVNPQEETAIFYEKPSIWSALYRRDFLEQHDIRFLETPGASYQDAGFNFKVWASATRAVFLDQGFLHYRQDGETQSVRSPGKVYCVCDEYAEMQRYLAQRPEKLAYLLPVLTKMKYDTYMWNFERLAPNLGREFLDRMAEEMQGHIDRNEADLAIFDPWKKTDLETLLYSVDLFFAQKTCKDDFSTKEKISHYLQIGGPSLLAKMLYRKLRA